MYNRARRLPCSSPEKCFTDGSGWHEHLELELTQKELDRTHRTGNPKSGSKSPRHIIVKFARYNNKRKVFVNKKRLKNTEISITESLTKHKMEFFKKAKNEFGFNV